MHPHLIHHANPVFHALATFFAALPNAGHVGHHEHEYWLKFSLAIVAGLLFLLALTVIPTRYRKATIAVFTFLGGIFYVAEFFWPTPGDKNPLAPYDPIVSNVSSVVASLAVGLGIYSLVGMHLRHIVRGRKDMGFSVVLVVSFVFMVIVHLMNAYMPGHIFVHGGTGFIHDNIAIEDVYQFLFTDGFVALNAAMFALIGFFIISASYRAFRIRSFEASLLMGSALIVMLGQVALGTALTNWLPKDGLMANFRLENLTRYILIDLNTPAQRAVTFGIALGALATSLRLWLSLERGYYF